MKEFMGLFLEIINEWKISTTYPIINHRKMRLMMSPAFITRKHTTFLPPFLEFSKILKTQKFNFESIINFMSHKELNQAIYQEASQTINLKNRTKECKNRLPSKKMMKMTPT